MKLKTLGALCKSKGVFSLLDDITEGGEIRGQWLGMNDALYLLTGLPYLTEENLITMFDITEKQREKILFFAGPLPEHLNFENSAPGEILLDREGMTFFCGGRSVRPLFAQNGVEFIDDDLMSPFANIADKVELFERHTAGGGTCFAVKFGLLIAAVIMPLGIIDEAFVECIEALARGCRDSLDRKTRGAGRAGGPVRTEL
jgi:hypothetical protein